MQEGYLEHNCTVQMTGSQIPTICFLEHWLFLYLTESLDGELQTFCKKLQMPLEELANVPITNHPHASTYLIAMTN
jgi:hypothetical protein